MKISMMIDLINTYSNGKLIADELKRQGHQVQVLNMTSFPGEIIGPIIEFQPQVIFGTHTHKHVPSWIMSTIKNKTKALMILWYVDAPGVFVSYEKRSFDMSKGIYDLMFVSTRGVADSLRNGGYAPNVIWLPQFYDPVFFGDPLKSLEDRIYDICFIGGKVCLNPEREKFVAVLANKYNFYQGGPGYGKSLWGKDSSTIYLKSKLAFDTLKEAIMVTDLSMSVRAFNAMANGCLYLFPFVPSLEVLFTPLKHMDVYDGTVEDLCKKIDFYLEHNELREDIAKAGQKLVLEKHTIEKRVKEYLYCIEKLMNGEILTPLF